MGVMTDRKISANCSLKGTILNLSFDPSNITDRLQRELEKKPGKMGVNFSWQDSFEFAELRIRFMKIDQGSRLVRYLICPLFAPALIEVEGELVLDDASPRSFHHTKKAYLGFLGGSPRGMLKFCACGIADKIAKDIRKEMISQPKIETDESQVGVTMVENAAGKSTAKSGKRTAGTSKSTRSSKSKDVNQIAEGILRTPLSVQEFFCPKCNRAVLESAEFCSHCGERLYEVTGYCCSNCGRDVEESWTTCPYCGESLEGEE